MDEFSTYEYVVKKKNKGIGRLKPVLYIIGYVLFAVSLFFIAIKTTIAAPLFALSGFFVALLVFLTWKYTKTEYEYSITSGHVTFSVINGNSQRRTVVSFPIKSCSTVAPIASDEHRARAEAYRAEKTYSALSELGATDGYFALFEDEKGKRCIFLFEATEKALKIFRFYNAPATVITKVSK